MDDQAYYRKRMICLARNGDTTQAHTACEALRSIKGVIEANPISHYRLTLTYSLQNLTFELIENLLKELGYYLDDSVFALIRRNIYQYLEDNAREKIHVDEEKHKLICDVDSELPHEEPDKYWHNYR